MFHVSKHKEEQKDEFHRESRKGNGRTGCLRRGEMRRHKWGSPPFGGESATANCDCLRTTLSSPPHAAIIRDLATLPVNRRNPRTRTKSPTMEQTKALNALEPFLALSKSATSPRAASDLVVQATSAPNTYVFAELLQTSNIQNLRTSEEYRPYLTLLEIFAWGTWADYKGALDSIAAAAAAAHMP